MYSQPSRGGEPQDMRILLCYVDVHDPSELPGSDQNTPKPRRSAKSDLNSTPPPTWHRINNITLFF